MTAQAYKLKGISADFQGCEIRVGAALSGDAGLYEAEVSSFCYLCLEDPCGCGKEHLGLHWRTAHAANGEGATKEHRYMAKRGCVPVDGSEILTRRGWLKHDQVRAGDETPALQADGSMAWTRVMLVAHYPDAPLTRLSVGKNWSAVVTPDHRWATRKRRDGGSRGRYFEDGITHAHDLTAEHVIKLSGLGLEGPGLPLTDAEVALIAWVYTDGHLEQSELTGRTSQKVDGSHRKIRASITQAKPRGVAALEGVLADCYAEFTVKTELNPLGDHCLPLKRYRLRTEFGRELWTRAGLIAVADKHAEGFDLTQFVLKMTGSQRRAFIQACEDAEGCRDRHGTLNLSQNEGAVLDAMELAGYLEGFYVKRYKHRVFNGVQHWKLTFTKPRVGCTRLKREDVGRGDVWCVQTETGSWTMRQDGANPMITGNTFTRLFGGGAETAADQVGCPVADMQKTFEAFNAQAPVFTAWDNQMRDWYKAGSMVWRDYSTGENHAVPVEGSQRMIYRAYSGRNIYINNGQHAAGNGAIQGTARELIVDGTLLWRRTKWGHLPLLPVHDQLLSFVPEHEADEASQVLARCMETRVLSSPGFEVFIGADIDKPFYAWQDSS